jgi:uncharacterized BrkB/YihY/UPF0761 family membrane protein
MFAPDGNRGKPLQGATAVIAQVIRWPILFIIVAAGLAFVYRFGPSRRKPQATGKLLRDRKVIPW